MKKKKFDNAAAVRSILSIREYFLKQAASCVKSKNETGAAATYVAASYKADSRECRQLAAYVEEEKYIRAFKYWRGLDTFVRDYIPKRTVAWLAKQAITEQEKVKHGYVKQRLRN